MKGRYARCATPNCGAPLFVLNAPGGHDPDPSERALATIIEPDGRFSCPQCGEHSKAAGGKKTKAPELKRTKSRASGPVGAAREAR